MGTFEVGELPSNDAVLLLVLEQKPASSMVGFQSFAFPMAGGKKDAQVAVINAFQHDDSTPRLKMEDHITGQEQQTVSKRVEQLGFNRIYSIEEGSYDASITDLHHKTGNTSSEAELERTTKKTLRLNRKSNYVVLRTGGGRFEESMVVFPPQGPLIHSGVQRFGLAWPVVLLASFIMVFTA